MRSKPFSVILGTKKCVFLLKFGLFRFDTKKVEGTDGQPTAKVSGQTEVAHSSYKENKVCAPSHFLKISKQTTTIVLFRKKDQRFCTKGSLFFFLFCCRLGFMEPLVQVGSPSCARPWSLFLGLVGGLDMSFVDGLSTSMSGRSVPLCTTLQPFGIEAFHSTLSV